MEGECNKIQSISWNTKPVQVLYGTENDPWEENDLTNDPAYVEVLKQMRTANEEWS